MGPEPRKPRRPGDPRDHAVRALLEEKLGGEQPPDLTARILTAADNASNADDSTALDDTMNRPDPSHASFETVAASQSQGLMREFCGFMAENSKWWLLPFLFVFGLLGIAVLLGTTGAAPFIYTLF